MPLYFCKLISYDFLEISRRLETNNSINLCGSLFTTWIGLTLKPSTLEKIEKETGTCLLVYFKLSVFLISVLDKIVSKS